VEAHGHMDHGGCALFVSHRPQRPEGSEMARRLLESPARLDSPRRGTPGTRARAPSFFIPVPDKSPRHSWADLGPKVCPSVHRRPVNPRGMGSQCPTRQLTCIQYSTARQPSQPDSHSSGRPENASMIRFVQFTWWKSPTTRGPEDSRRIPARTKDLSEPQRDSGGIAFLGPNCQ